MQSKLSSSRSRLVGLVAAILTCLTSAGVWSQTTPIAGIRENTPQVHALTNLRIVQSPGVVIEKGTVVLRDGVIEAVGAQVVPPPDARIWDYEGLTVYPGLIESYSQLGLPKKEKKANQRGPSNKQDANQAKGDTYWNPNVHPETNAIENYAPKKEDLEKLRSLGFTAALVVPEKGIFSGSGAVVSLGNDLPNEELLKDRVVQNIVFKAQGGFRSRTYPGSQMGVIALIRQTLLDAQWYRRAHNAYNLNPSGQTRPETNESLEALALAAQGRQPVLFKVEDDLNFLRALNVVKEFGLQAWVLGNGYEYRQLRAVKASGVPVILPLDFPEAPVVDSPEEALSVSLVDLEHWDAAPENPRRLQEAGVSFALTTARLKKPTDFYKQVREAIERGLSEDAALAALTTTPARMLGLQQQLGTVEAGKLAHLMVTDGDLFQEKTKILDVWVDGNRYRVKEKPEVDPRGKWAFTLRIPDGQTLNLELELKGEPEKLTGSILQDSTKIKVKKVALQQRRLLLTFAGDDLGFVGVVRLSGAVAAKHLAGQGELPDGKSLTWSAERQEPLKAEQGKSKKETKVAREPAKPLESPPGAFGLSRAPEQLKHVLVQGATIWTSGPQGILDHADLLVTQGKITKVGQNIKAPADALIIDGKGKHVTPGLIDAHSHSALSAVNEGTQAVTAEVRMSDVVNSYDIALYRELAGGLTVANQLHGSANPIGGQNSVIKLRWGESPDHLKFAGAMPGIKFALGENVKQSNWGDDFTTRYPQTRMGVEQIIRDRFHAALDYEKEWQTYNASKKKKGVIPPRRDLELETLLEILHGKRLVHSHSYRQDEILMLTRIAEDFGFTIGIFQHVLEGYKVADVLAKHGAGASTFSDWWAYKFEVYDAIPYNGALMHNAGVVVSFNSDSNELARRLNTEAAKAVKYGGLSEEEALKFVTLNPARQLHIDDRVGSLEPGKDADFVIWNGNPLSTYTLCEQTWVDGKKYFDRSEDMKIRQQVKAERARLIQKVLASQDKKKNGGSKSAPTD